ncbi:MAG: putative lipid II flippase FtsW [Elusimicrobiota bacterium]
MIGITRRLRPIDFTFLSLTLALVSFGFVMLYSASAILADQNFGDPLFYLKRQLIWTIFGFAALAWVSRVDYHRLREWVWPLLVLTLCALAGVLLSAPIAGARRWIRFGSFGLQPAEFAKLTIIVFLADYLDRKRSKVVSLTQGLIVPGLVVGVNLMLIGLEPDLGTPILIFMSGILMLYIGGTRFKHIATTLCLAVPVVLFEILRYDYRRERLLSFLTPFQSAQGTGYQLSQALMAVGSGGWLGKGLGDSQLKLMYLPAPHTDFIFPVICEEVGLLGALALLGLFLWFLLRGIRIARNAPDLFGTILAAGLTFLICLQAFFNISMSIGLLPTKGVPLPFFSYGGSSMLTVLTAVGILLNISRYSTERQRGRSLSAPRGGRTRPAGSAGLVRAR